MIIAVAGGGDDLGHLRFGRDWRRGERERRQAEAHQHACVIVADQLLGEALGHVGRAGVVLDDERDLLAGDRIAVLLNVELRGRALLFAGRGRRAGHRHDHADGHGIVVGQRRRRRAARRPGRGQDGAKDQVSGNHRMVLPFGLSRRREL